MRRARPYCETNAPAVHLGDLPGERAKLDVAGAGQVPAGELAGLPDVEVHRGAVLDPDAEQHHGHARGAGPRTARGRGRVVIEYTGVDDFDAILRALGQRS